jgi:hypothetical protein
MSFPFVAANEVKNVCPKHITEFLFIRAEYFFKIFHQIHKTVSWVMTPCRLVHFYNCLKGKSASPQVNSEGTRGKMYLRNGPTHLQDCSAMIMETAF